MKWKILALIALMIFSTGRSVRGAEQPTVTHYSLNIHVFPKDESLAAAAFVTVNNSTQDTLSDVSVLLYRLLEVPAVADDDGHALTFDQRVVKVKDEGNLQVNQLTIHLVKSLLAGESQRFAIRYQGSIYGYPEVMAYTRDRIDTSYSLIRPDVFAYPVLALPTRQSEMASYEARFTYQAAVTVPSGYDVACGGHLVSVDTAKDSTTFVFKRDQPTWRMDLAVAKFAVISNDSLNLRVYVMPQDTVGARYVVQQMQKVIDLYTSWFGPAKYFQGYTAIEIPGGWGSQASDGYFMQTAAAFRDSQRVSEVYHEIGHTWNVKTTLQLQRCRWFDEAFASYFESLALSHFSGQKAFEQDMENSRDIFARWADYDPRNSSTPIADYWKEELGRNSYSKGAWSLYVLNQIVGDQTFRRIIKDMMSQFADRQIDFHSFQKLAETESGKNLTKFFDEWIYGSLSSELLIKKTPIDEIVKRYQ